MNTGQQIFFLKNKSRKIKLISFVEKVMSPGDKLKTADVLNFILTQAFDYYLLDIFIGKLGKQELMKLLFGEWILREFLWEWKLCWTEDHFVLCLVLLYCLVFSLVTSRMGDMKMILTEEVFQLQWRAGLGFRDISANYEGEKRVLKDTELNLIKK